MKELKYPPGVRFIFLLALSIFSGLLLITIFNRSGGSLGGGQLSLFSIIALSLSFPIFVISVLPWAKNSRKKTFFCGLALLILSTYFLLIDGVRYRIEWFYFLPVISFACFMIYKIRQFAVLKQQDHVLKGTRYRLFIVALFTTPFLTLFSIFLVEDLRVEEMILMPPAWFLIIGIIFKLLGGEKKILVFTGELSIVLFFPIFIMLGMGSSSSGPKQGAFYFAALIASLLFFLCPLIVSIKSRITEGNHQNLTLPPLVADSYRKPSMPTMWAENHGGRVLLIGFLALGVIGFVLGVFAPNGFLGIDTGGLHGGLMGLISAILFPISVILFPVILFFIGCYIAVSYTHLTLPTTPYV